MAAVGTHRSPPGMTASPSTWPTCSLMGWPAPVYRHHRLILGPDGRRLAKRDQAATLADLRERGVTAAQVKAQLGFPSP